MALIDKYFTVNKLSQGTNDLVFNGETLITVLGKKYTRESLIEAIEDSAIALQKTPRFSSEYASVKTLYSELIRVSVECGLNVNSEFRTVGK